MEYENVSSIIILLEHYITNGNLVKTWQLFQRKDLNVKIVNEYEDTLLHLVLKSPKFSVYQAIALLDFLITWGADINAKNKNEETILHLAIERQYKDVIEYLLKKKAKTSVTNRKGHSLTHFFVKDAAIKYVGQRYSHRNILEPKNIVELKYANFAEWLMLRGFDFHVKNNKGHSAVRWAITFNLHYIIVAILKYTEDIYINFVTGHTKRTLLQLFLDANCEARRSGHKFRSLDLATIKALEAIPKVHPDEFTQRYDVEIVNILIKRGVSIDQPDCNGVTALKTAIRSAENMEIIEMLLKRIQISSQCDVERGQRLIRTVIKNAILNSRFSDYYYKILTSFIKKGVDINRKDVNGETFVFYAASFKNFRAVDFLRENKANFGVISKTGQNLFHIVAKECPIRKPYAYIQLSPDLLELLNKQGCDINARDNRGQTPLQLAVESHDLNTIANIIKYGADVNCGIPETGWNPLHIAIFQESLGTLELLLSKGADVNVQCSSQGQPLHAAIRKKSLAIVELLLSKGANINGNSNKSQPLHVAINQKSFLLVALLLNKGADINGQSMQGQPLHVAVLQKSLRIIELLLDRGADINGQSLQGQPLHVAISHESFSIVELLLNKGADINGQSLRGQPLHVAVLQKSHRIIELLLSKGADINGQSLQGRPLHVAIKSDFLEILLKLKADVNGRDCEGESVLFKALRSNRCDFVEQLIMHGADVNDININCVIDSSDNKNSTQIVLKHWIKLNAANLPTSKEYTNFIQANDYDDFFAECLREIESLKKTFIKGRMSLYNWLHVDPNRRHLYCQEVELKILVEPRTLIQKFPQYSSVIMGYYHEAIARRKLLHAAIEGWFKLTNIYLPELCVERISAHLNTGYLLEMAELLNEPNRA